MQERILKEKKGNKMRKRKRAQTGLWQTSENRLILTSHPTFDQLWSNSRTDFAAAGDDDVAVAGDLEAAGGWNGGDVAKRKIWEYAGVRN